MDQIAVIINENIAKQTYTTLHYSVFQASPPMLFVVMCDELLSVIDMSRVSDLVMNVSDFGKPNATLISFKYDGRSCEVGERNDEIRDYFWVKMLPVYN